MGWGAGIWGKDPKIQDTTRAFGPHRKGLYLLLRIRFFRGNRLSGAVVKNDHLLFTTV